MASLLNDALTIIQVRLQEKPVELISEIDPSLPAALEGDETRVRQILLNLLSNAVKYTGQGFVKFSAAGEKNGEGQIKLTFRVADSGIGIKPEDMEKLFGEFVRVDQSRNTSIEGSGLGLVIARNLCRAMGGDIYVESEYGKGSVFTASLVQIIAGEQMIGDIESKLNAAPQYEEVLFTAPGVRALLVDDIPTNLMVIKGLLAPYRMEVSACLNGREAIEFIGRERFDIVFMDHMMPEMNGIEATAAIRAMEGEYFQEVPIIALTANAISGMREMFLQNGFNDYLAKPIEIPKLNQIMERWIDKKKRVKQRLPLPAALETGLEIKGLDVNQGLYMTGGSMEGYLKVLDLYRQDAAQRLEALASLPQESDLPLFITQVHALKSASASIGAKALAEKAASLEAAGNRSDLSAISRELDEFRTALARLAHNIGLALPAAEACGGEAPMDRESLLRLQEALAAEDIGTADSILNVLKGKAFSRETARLVCDLADCLLLSDFRTAADITGQMLNKLER
jgi:CheY-like chemotaxis protein